MTIVPDGPVEGEIFRSGLYPKIASTKMPLLLPVAWTGALPAPLFAGTTYVKLKPPLTSVVTVGSVVPLKDSETVSVLLNPPPLICNRVPAPPLGGDNRRAAYSTIPVIAFNLLSVPIAATETLNELGSLGVESVMLNVPSLAALTEPTFNYPVCW